MSDLRAVRLVAVREAGDRLRNRAFVLGTLLVVAGVVAAIVLPALAGRDTGPSYHLGVVGAPVEDSDVETFPRFETVVAEAAEAQNVEIAVSSIDDEEEAADLLRDGDVDAVLLDDELVTDGEPPALSLVSIVDTARARTRLTTEIDRLDLSTEQVSRLTTPVEPVTVVDLGGGTAGAFAPEQAVMAFAGTVLLFLVIQINGSSLLTGAIEEKSSRVIEVLLGTLRPRHLLAGKLFALTGIALGQAALIVGAAYVANTAVRLFEIPDVTGSVILVSTIMITVGFAFYAAMYIVAGSMTSSVEDAQAIAGPLAIAVIATYMAVIFMVIPSPGGTAATALTFLPPTAPFTVPARVALDAIPRWQVITAIATTLVGTVLAVALGARLYSAALLAGGKLTWREVWRSEPIR